LSAESRALGGDRHDRSLLASQIAANKRLAAESDINQVTVGKRAEHLSEQAPFAASAQIFCVITD